MSQRDEALRLLNERIDTEAFAENATVQTAPPTAKTAITARFDPDTVTRLHTEATRRGITPSTLIRDLVTAALAEPAPADDTVTVRLSDLRRAVESIARPAAA